MLLDLLFPKTCLSCDRLGSYVCLECQRKFQIYTGEACIICNRKTKTGETHQDCKQLSSVDGVVSILDYQAEIKKVIKKLKYRLLYAAFDEFFQSITPLAVEKIVQFKRKHPRAVLQPIPLHADRQKWRGYNQAQIIARFFHSLSGYETVNYLTRVKKTAPQAATHSRQERETNIRGAFEVTGEIEEREVVLVDDVITTGYTSQEAAGILKKSGIPRVYVFTVARGR